MDSKLESLFRAMLSFGWITASNGEVESPTGFFGYMTNTRAEVPEILSAFEDITDNYGVPDTQTIVGHWIVRINSDGIIFTDKYNTAEEMSAQYDYLSARYLDWCGDNAGSSAASDDYSGPVFLESDDDYEEYPIDETRNAYGP